MRDSSSYAADNLLTTLSTQIDVLLFGTVLTLHDMGVYQSGARLVQVRNKIIDAYNDVMKMPV